jgi:predicted enzyme related to lactoylglutathione lyase
MTTGAIVWYELLSTDPKGSLAFYPEVVGWKTEPFGTENYTMFVGSQGPLGGVAQLPEQAQKMGAPTYWQANIQVANVDATVEKVKQLGGQIYVLETVPTVGRFAVIADPQGAVVAVFTPDKEMAPHDVTKAGELSWHELYTTDHEAAFSFYSQIAGWERLGSFDMGPMGTYLLWGRNGQQLGGMMTKPATMPQPPGWLYYITTPDLEAALARAQARGAKLMNGPMEVPGGQRIVQMMDPQGGAFAMVTPPKT